MPLAPNQQLSEYRIERILGRGAFGTVYLAHDTLLDRPVAIKELTLTAQTDEVTFKRFLQEARAAGGLNHPHIVTVHALKVVEPNVYLVMEYLAGGSLRALLEERGRLPVEDAARIAADVCEGLAAAHAKGIIHRDVKPGNILLAEDGRAKVGDFGIAHVPRGAEGTRLTQAGFQPGTLIYMSPEQIRGQQVDGRSDVYQVGALLYEMLTGQHYVNLGALERRARETAGSNVMLFQARLFELLSEGICERTPERICRMRPDVPECMGEAVVSALTKRMEERPIARELGQALRQALVEERVESPLVSEHQDWPEEWPTVGASRINWDGVPVHLQGGGLRLHWAFQAGRRVTVPAVAHGMVFVRSVDGSVYALDARTGQQRWSFATDSFWASSSVQNGDSGYMPVIAGGAVLVASEDGHVYALDVATGQPRWTSNIKMDTAFQWIAGIVTTDRLVLVATGARIYALDMETGKKCWVNDEMIPSYSPAVVEGVAFVTGWRGVMALDVATGRTRWSVALWDDPYGTGCAPAVADGMVFVECYGRLLGLDAATGRQSRDCEAQGQIWSLSVANGMAFIGSIGCVYALHTASGRQVWAFQIPRAFVPVSPAVAGEVVFAGTAPLDAISGEAPPRHSSEENLFALHAATGRKLWAVDTGWAAIGPSVAGGMVFVGSGDGKVYAFGR